MLDRELQSHKLAFFGAVTASLSHELKNVLATINEYAGLLDDQVHAATAERPLNPERLATLSTRLAKQVDRGATLIGRLNRFSHTVDEPVAAVNVPQLLGELCDLCDRFATLAQVTLVRDFAADAADLVVRLDPLAWQQAVYLAIRGALNAGAPSRQLHLALVPADRGCTVVLRSADSLAPVFQALAASPLMQKLLQELDGALSCESAVDGSGLAITLRR